MTNPTRLLLVLVLVLVTASAGYGEEPRSGPAAVGSSPQARKALAESIPRREKELALLERNDVLTEVEQRMQEMDVSASADELTDLLERRAHLQIDLDKCQLGSNKAGRLPRDGGGDGGRRGELPQEDRALDARVPRRSTGCGRA